MSRPQSSAFSGAYWMNSAPKIVPNRRAEAAERRADEQRDRERRQEDERIDRAEVDREQSAGHAGIRGGEREGGGLEHCRVEPGRDGRKLGIAYRPQRPSELPAEQEPGEEQRAQRDTPRLVVGRRRQTELDALAAAGHAGEAVRAHEVDERHTERERAQREVRAVQAQRRQPEQEARQAGDRGGDGNRPPHAPAVVEHEVRGRVAADAHERALTERDLPRVAGDDVQAQEGDEVEADLRHVARLELPMNEGSTAMTAMPTARNSPLATCARRIALILAS